jgi:hypothetical protein
MGEDVDFVDLSALKKIQPDTMVEKFGSTINSSFFDASNVLGTLKIKGLVDFTSSIGGQNAITITDEGKKALEEADSRSMEPIDNLDSSILMQLSSGKKSVRELESALNLRPKDLSLRLYKLDEQQFVKADFRNGNLEIVLTEKGFMQAKTPVQQTKPEPAPQQVQQVNATSQQKMQVPQAQQQQNQMGILPEDLSKTPPAKVGGSSAKSIFVVVIIILLVLIVLAFLNVI